MSNYYPGLATTSPLTLCLKLVSSWLNCNFQMLLDAPGIVDSTKAAMANFPEVVKDLVRVLQLKSRSGQNLDIRSKSYKGSHQVRSHSPLSRRARRPLGPSRSPALAAQASPSLIPTTSGLALLSEKSDKCSHTAAVSIALGHACKRRIALGM